MNRVTNPPAPHVEEFRIYPEDTPAVNPGGWVGCWRLLCPKYTKVTRRYNYSLYRLDKTPKTGYVFAKGKMVLLGGG